MSPVTMSLLARAKARGDTRPGLATIRSERQQNLLGASLSVALLVGLGANAVPDWW